MVPGSVAVMTKAYPNVERSDLILLQDIASYLLLACGLIYVVSGVLCLGVLKRSRQQKAISREQATKDLEELEKRREELEALLLAERSELVWWQRSNVFAQCRLIVAPADSIPLVHPRRSVTRNHFRWCASFSCFWFSSRFLLNWVSGVSILRGYIDRLGLSRVSVVRFMSMWLFWWMMYHPSLSVVCLNCEC